MTGNCPAGQIVTAITTGGVTCVDPNSINIPDLGSCPAGSYVSGTTTSGVTCAVDQVGVGGGGAAPGVCPVNQYVIATTATGVTCGTVTGAQVIGDVVPGSCPAGSYVSGTTTSGVTCAVDQVGAAGTNYWTLAGGNLNYSYGNVGIGKVPAVGTRLDVNGIIAGGNIISSGSVTSASVSTGTVAASTQVNSARYCNATGGNCYDFVINASGLCYTAPATCKLTTQICNGHISFNADYATTCDFVPKASLDSFCMANCADYGYLCDGRTPPQCTGGSAVGYQTGSGACEGGISVLCQCDVSAPYTQETYTPSGTRCV